MKRLRILATVAVAAFTLTACNTMPNDTPEGRVYNAYSAYQLGMRLNLVYETLPRCMGNPTAAEAVRAVCSKADAVLSIRSIDNAAFSAVEILGAGVTSPAIEAIRATIAAERLRLHSDNI